MLALGLPPDVERRLTALAKRTGRTKSFYAREAIARFLDDMEDTFIAIERLERPERRWTLEELEQRVDLERRVGRPRKARVSSP